SSKLTARTQLHKAFLGIIFAAAVTDHGRRTPHETPGSPWPRPRPRPRDDRARGAPRTVVFRRPGPLHADARGAPGRCRALLCRRAVRPGDDTRTLSGEQRPTEVTLPRVATSKPSRGSAARAPALKPAR